MAIDGELPEYGVRQVETVPLIALRNAALLAVASDTLLRRSELVSVMIEDLQRADDRSATQM